MNVLKSPALNAGKNTKFYVLGLKGGMFSFIERRCNNQFRILYKNMLESFKFGLGIWSTVYKGKRAAKIPGFPNIRQVEKKELCRSMRGLVGSLGDEVPIYMGKDGKKNMKDGRKGNT